MTQTWVSVVKKSPCGQGTLCKAMGLQTSTRAKGNSLALVWAEGYFHAVVQRLWEGTRVGEGGAETDG